jgi:hypothetical protein
VQIILLFTLPAVRLLDAFQSALTGDGVLSEQESVRFGIL